MVEGILVHEIAIGGKTGIVPIFDMGAVHLVTPLIGALPVATCLIITSVAKKFVPDTAVIGHPHADIRVPYHFCLLCLVCLIRFRPCRRCKARGRCKSQGRKGHRGHGAGRACILLHVFLLWSGVENRSSHLCDRVANRAWLG